MADITKYNTEQRYKITLMVTAQQEFAIQGLFSLNGWAFSKVIEIPRFTDVNEIKTLAVKNDISSLSLTLPENTQLDQLARASEDKGDHQISNEGVSGHALYKVIKKEVGDSDTESADEINHEVNVGETVKDIGTDSGNELYSELVAGENVYLPDFKLDRKNEFVDKSVPRNGKSASSKVIKGFSQSDKAIKNRKTVNKVTSEFQRKIAERSQKVIEQFGEEKSRVHKFLYEDGDAERNKVDNHIDEMSLVLRKDDILVCCMCRESYPDDTKFKDHASVCLKNLFELKDSHVHKCNDCPAYFRQAFTYLRHRKYELCVPGKERKATILKCKYCSKTYSSKRRTEFIHHIQSHENERPFECDECGQKFGRWQTLKCHKRRHTGEKPYKCGHCELRFSSITGQRSHEQTRHMDLPKSFVCEKCGTAFKMKSSLSCHIREVHDIPVTYTCDFCSKEFSRKSSLVYHRKAHTNSRDKVCEICGKGFYRQSYLTLHMKRHNNERSHFCDLCGKGFYSRKNLADHRRSHTGDKPFTCTLCNYQCAYYSNTVKHIRNKHPKVTVMKSVISKNASTTAVTYE